MLFQGGITGSFKNKKTNPKPHWLDHAEDRFGRRLVDEVKILLNILVLYLPLPIFWTLFDQQGSRWTFQATRMDGNLGFYEIKPDQAQVVNPILILLFIPLYEVLFYPALNLVGVRRPLQKLALGGILAGVAFFVSFLLEMQINKTSAVLPKATEAHLRIYNMEPCDFSLRVDGGEAFILRSLHVYENKDLTMEKNSVRRIPYAMTVQPGFSCASRNGNVEIESEKSSSYVLTSLTTLTPFDDNPDKDREGNAIVRFVTSFPSTVNIKLQDSSKGDIRYDRPSNNMTRASVKNTKYHVLIANNRVGDEIELKVGGVYSINVINVNSAYVSSFSLNFKKKTVSKFFFQRFNIYEVTPANGVNMLWIIPQYVIMTLGEVMYSITGLEFSFTQAPQSMKSVLTGCWMLTIAFGNLVIVFIAELKFFDNQMWEFLMFACLMWVDMLLFGFLAYRYKAIPIKSDDDYERERLAEEDANVKKLEKTRASDL